MNNPLCRLAYSAILLGTALGCQGDPTVWSKDFHSPDGAWVATAQTKEWGGFGTGWVETTVSIRKVDETINRGKPFDVFSYPDGGSGGPAYVLSDANADLNLKIAWLSPTHLEIDSTSPVKPDLEVVRFSNIDITYQLSPGNAMSNERRPRAAKP